VPIKGHLTYKVRAKGWGIPKMRGIWPHILSMSPTMGFNHVKHKAKVINEPKHRYIMRPRRRRRRMTGFLGFTPIHRHKMTTPFKE